MNHIIQSFAKFHDNYILRYSANFEANTLCLDTKSASGQIVSLHFSHVIAHWFENIIQDNIILGIDEITINGFLELYQKLLLKTMNYGFPAHCSSLEQLCDYIKQEKIRVFVIDSSLGLCGFVLAKNVELRLCEKS